MPRSESKLFPSVDYTSTEAYVGSIKAGDGKLTLFNSMICPFGARALWTAVEIGANFTQVELDLSNESLFLPTSTATYHLLNNREEVPVLADNGFLVSESPIVAQYLDQKVDNKLDLFRKSDAKQASLVRLVMNRFEVGALYGLLRNKDRSKDAEFIAEIRSALGAVETVYRENAAAYRSAGPYLLGDVFSAAEIHIVPFLHRFSITLSHYRNYDVTESTPLLRAALEACQQRQAFRETTLGDAYFKEGYARYAN